MKNIIKSLQIYKQAMIWSLFYITSVFLILFLLFDFNILSKIDWTILINSRLQNFSGFVFGVLLLSIVPLYFATIYLIVKNKKTIFKIFETKKETKIENDEIDTEIKTENDTPQIPEHIPIELHGAFLRIKRNSVNNFSTFELKDLPNENTVSENTNLDNIPLPDNFDLTESEFDPDSFDFPKFKEINFDDDKRKPNENSEIIKLMMENNIDINIIDDEIIVYKDMSIISHTDSDFWIADNENWFANGKQKKSPIESVLNISNKHGYIPVIYLGNDNIMNIEEKIEDWKSKGIKIINNLDELFAE